MKKALLILFAVVMVISLSSCEQIFDTIKGLFGGGDDEEQVDGPAPPPADEYENDDNADYAYGDHLNLITRHTFHSPTDEDWISAYLYYGTSYVFETRSAGGLECDTYIELYDAGGYLCDSDDDGGYNLYSRIEFSPDSDGYYYLRIAEYDYIQYGSGDYGEYEVSVGINY